MIRLFTISLAFVLVLGQDEPKRILDLIEKLRSEKIEERDDTAGKLKKLGKAALPELLKASAGADPEVAARVRRLLRVIEIQGRLTANLMKILPGVEDRLASGDDHAWTELFIKAAHERSQRLEHSVTRTFLPGGEKLKDLELASIPGLRAAESSEERVEVTKGIARWNLKCAIPEVAKLLKDANPRVRESAVRALASLDAVDRVPDLLTVLEDKDESVRLEAVQSINRFQAPEIVPEMIKRLRDEAWSVRFCTVELLGKRGAREAIPEARRLLRDNHFWCRKCAVEALLWLNDAEATPEIMRLLEDPDDEVRKAAIEALGEFDALFVIPRLIQVVNNPTLRFEAVKALERLGAREASGQIAALLADGNLDFKCNAVRSLGNLGDREVVESLVLLLKEKNTHLRYWTASSLCRLGDRRGAEPLLRVYEEFKQANVYSAPGSLFALNALRQPALWKKLSERPLEVGPDATTQEILVALGKQAEIGMNEFSSQVKEDEAWSWSRSDIRRVLTPAHRKSLLRTMEYLLELQMSPYEAILEPDCIRILPRDEAPEYWRRWWASTQADERKSLRGK